MDKRQEILNTALQLFCSRGYDAVGVQEIAERSKVTKPTLYYYFKSKYGLLEELLKQGSEPLLAHLARAAVFEGDLRRTLCGCARVLADFAQQDPSYFQLLYSLYQSPKENEAYQAARPYILRQQGLIQGVFEGAAGLLGNMHGRQKQFGLGFSGLLHYYIVMKLEESTTGAIQISDEEISLLVHQFMHGIFS